MKAKDIKSLEQAESYCEGLLNDFELGISDKSETMKALAEYTIRIAELKAQALGYKEEGINKLLESQRKRQNGLLEILSMIRFEVISGYRKGFVGYVVTYEPDNELPIILQNDDFNGCACKLNELKFLKLT